MSTTIKVIKKISSETRELTYEEIEVSIKKLQKEIGLTDLQTNSLIELMSGDLYYSTLLTKPDTDELILRSILNYNGILPFDEYVLPTYKTREEFLKKYSHITVKAVSKMITDKTGQYEGGKTIKSKKVRFKKDKLINKNSKDKKDKRNKDESSNNDKNESSNDERYKSSDDKSDNESNQDIPTVHRRMFIKTKRPILYQVLGNPTNLMSPGEIYMIEQNQKGRLFMTQNIYPKKLFISPLMKHNITVDNNRKIKNPTFINNLPGAPTVYDRMYTGSYDSSIFNLMDTPEMSDIYPTNMKGTTSLLHRRTFNHYPLVPPLDFGSQITSKLGNEKLVSFPILKQANYLFDNFAINYMIYNSIAMSDITQKIIDYYLKSDIYITKSKYYLLKENNKKNNVFIESFGSLFEYDNKFIQHGIGKKMKELYKDKFVGMSSLYNMNQIELYQTLIFGDDISNNYSIELFNKYKNYINNKKLINDYYNSIQNKKTEELFTELKYRNIYITHFGLSEYFKIIPKNENEFKTSLNILNLISEKEKKIILLEYERQEKYWKAKSNSNCPHFRLYEIFTHSNPLNKVKTYKEVENYISSSIRKISSNPNDFIKCSNCNFDLICPHMVEYMEMYKSKIVSVDDIGLIIHKYASDNTKLKNAYYCKICGEAIEFIEDEGIIKMVGEFNMYSGNTDDELSNSIFKESRMVIIGLQFKNPPTNKVINKISRFVVSQIKEFIYSIEKTIKKSKTISIEEADNKLKFFIVIYVYAMLLNIIKKDPNEINLSTAKSKNINSIFDTAVKEIIYKYNVMLKFLESKMELNEKIIKTYLYKAYQNISQNVSSDIQLKTDIKIQQLINRLFYDSVFTYILHIYTVDYYNKSKHTPLSLPEINYLNTKKYLGVELDKITKLDYTYQEVPKLSLPVKPSTKDTKEYNIYLIKYLNIASYNLFLDYIQNKNISQYIESIATEKQKDDYAKFKQKQQDLRELDYKVRINRKSRRLPLIYNYNQKDNLFKYQDNNLSNIYGSDGHKHKWEILVYGTSHYTKKQINEYYKEEAKKYYQENIYNLNTIPTLLEFLNKDLFDDNSLIKKAEESKKEREKSISEYEKSVSNKKDKKSEKSKTTKSKTSKSKSEKSKTVKSKTTKSKAVKGKAEVPSEQSSNSDDSDDENIILSDDTDTEDELDTNDIGINSDGFNGESSLMDFASDESNGSLSTGGSISTNSDVNGGSSKPAFLIQKITDYQCSICNELKYQNKKYSGVEELYKKQEIENFFNYYKNQCPINKPNAFHDWKISSKSDTESTICKKCNVSMKQLNINDKSYYNKYKKEFNDHYKFRDEKLSKQLKEISNITFPKFSTSKQSKENIKYIKTLDTEFAKITHKDVMGNKVTLNEYTNLIKNLGKIEGRDYQEVLKGIPLKEKYIGQKNEADYMKVYNEFLIVDYNIIKNHKNIAKLPTDMIELLEKLNITGKLPDFEIYLKKSYWKELYKYRYNNPDEQAQFSKQFLFTAILKLYKDSGMKSFAIYITNKIINHDYMTTNPEEFNKIAVSIDKQKEEDMDSMTSEFSLENYDTSGNLTPDTMTSDHIENIFKYQGMDYDGENEEGDSTI